ncbi:CsxC family protein, partial [Clostridium sp. Mt-5]
TSENNTLEGTDSEDTVLENNILEDTNPEDITLENNTLGGTDSEIITLENNTLEGTDSEDTVLENNILEDTNPEDITLENNTLGGTDSEIITLENNTLEGTDSEDTVLENNILEDTNPEIITLENNTLEDTNSENITLENSHDKFNNGTNKNEINNKITIENCKTTVISETLPLCENTPHTSQVTKGPVTIKVPVVITECKVTINVQSSLKLEDTVLEIKDIRKNAYLNQCELIPDSENDKPNTGIVFINGFIRKNIEYTTKEYVDKVTLKGKLKHATVKVPFKCTTRVTFKTPPKFTSTASQYKVDILETNIKICDSCKEDMIGSDIHEQSFKLTESFNEKVFCELINAEITETDILENPEDRNCELPLDQGFHIITEKVVLLLTIKLLQNQDVEISK